MVEGHQRALLQARPADLAPEPRVAIEGVGRRGRESAPEPGRVRPGRGEPYTLGGPSHLFLCPASRRLTRRHRACRPPCSTSSTFRGSAPGSLLADWPMQRRCLAISCPRQSRGSRSRRALPLQSWTGRSRPLSTCRRVRNASRPLSRRAPYPFVECQSVLVHCVGQRPSHPVREGDAPLLTVRTTFCIAYSRATAHSRSIALLPTFLPLADLSTCIS